MEELFNNYSVINVDEIVNQPVKVDSCLQNYFGVCNLFFDKVIEGCLGSAEYNDPLILGLINTTITRPFKKASPLLVKTKRK